MGNKKTRFVVKVDGVERELFSVEESSRGDLTIVLATDRPQSVLHKTTTTHRLSVHATRDASDGGFTIKETVKDSSGGEENRYAYVRPNEGHALLPVFSRTASSLRMAPDSSQKPRRDTVTVYEDHTGGPVFFIITVSREALPKRYFPARTTLIERSFREYFLYVTAGVFVGSATGSNASVTMMSSGPRADGVYYDRLANFDVPEPISPTPDQLRFFIEMRIAELSEMLIWQRLTFRSDEEVEPTFKERLEKAVLADLYMPTSNSEFTTSVKARLSYFRRNPPPDLVLHPPGAVFTYVPREGPSFAKEGG